MSHKSYPSQFTLGTGSTYTSTSGTASTLITPTTSDDPSYETESHPQDHTKLKTAWEIMLSKRFLSSQLLSVLPFYISSCFTDVQSHPTLEIPLPPNSLSTSGGATRDRTSLEHFDLNSQFVFQSSNTRRSNDAESTYTRANVPASQDTAPYWATMHLAKVVETIVGCKESIWAEYQHLNSPELPPVVRTVRPKDFRALSHMSSVREDFDSAWANWYK